MKIALDYDKTYTVDPMFWDKIIDLAKERGHTVSFVTMRYPTQKEELKIAEHFNIPIPVVYTGRKAKVQYCLNNGIEFDIWIDDKPYYLLNDSF